MLGGGGSPRKFLSFNIAHLEVIQTGIHSTDPQLYAENILVLGEIISPFAIMSVLPDCVCFCPARLIS